MNVPKNPENNIYQVLIFQSNISMKGNKKNEKEKNCPSSRTNSRSDNEATCSVSVNLPEIMEEGVKVLVDDQKMQWR